MHGRSCTRVQPDMAPPVGGPTRILSIVFTAFLPLAYLAVNGQHSHRHGQATREDIEAAIDRRQNDPEFHRQRKNDDK